MTKVCQKCFDEKPFSSFYKDKTRGRYRSVCKSCSLSQNRSWRKENKERKSETDRTYRYLNKDRIKNYQSTYYSLNKPHYAERTARRKASKLQATPHWLSEKQLEEIAYIYNLRSEMNFLSDYEYHVDHIIPLQGENVCGLHVPWNLQLLPKEINLAKSNRH